jgi:nucleotide-binding universal stress UspA family protein
MNALLASLCRDLRKKFQAIQRPEDFTAMNQAYELYAEAITCLTLMDKGVALERTPMTGQHKQKRPDFVHHHPSGEIYFEVKALEIADSYQRHKDIAEAGLEVAAELAERAKKPGVHFSELPISTHREEATAAERIDETAKRIANTIEPDQIHYGPTVLVVDLGRLPGSGQGPSGILPVFYNDGPPAQGSASGELWHIALGLPGERIFVLPEADGFSNLDGHQAERGVLHRFPSLLALMFQFCRWNDPCELYTIWRPGWDKSKLKNPCTLEEHEIEDFLYRCSDGLNNDRNEIGWKFRVRR